MGLVNTLPDNAVGLFSSETITAALAILLHVANYNAIAQLEFHTKIFTKIFGRPAVYLNAVYLIASAVARDHTIQVAMNTAPESLSFPTNAYPGYGLFLLGVLLNLWTLQTLGIKGMYNGDSFGWLFDKPVTGGPFKHFSDPQSLLSVSSLHVELTDSGVPRSSLVPVHASCAVLSAWMDRTCARFTVVGGQLRPTNTCRWTYDATQLDTMRRVEGRHIYTTLPALTEPGCPPADSLISQRLPAGHSKTSASRHGTVCPYQASGR